MKILHVIISKGFAGSELYTVNLINHQSKNNDTFLIKSDENIHHSFKLLDVPYHDWSDQNKNKEG